MSDRDKYRRRSRSRSKQKQRYRERSRSPKRESYQEKSKSNYYPAKQSSNYNNKPKQYPSSSSYTNTSSTLKQKQKSKLSTPSSQQPTKTLCIQQFPISLLSQLQQKLSDTSITIGTSLPDDIQPRENNLILIKYPSIQVSSLIFTHLHGSIKLKSLQSQSQYNKNQYKQFNLRYYPFKKTDINILYDWYCNKCDYKNFARRSKCHRCQNQRNSQCKLNYSSQFVTFPTTISTNNKQKQEQSANCSLMIRGPVIMEIQEQVLLDLFEKFAPIKDIRMIRNKVTGANKDFAFVEFFSPEEAASALNKATAYDFRVAGERVTVMYSRSKQDEDYYSRTTPFEKRGGPPLLPKKQTKNQQFVNYYQRQRQLQIQQEKKRPLITLQQLKQKREQQLKKAQPLQQKQMTQQQKTRKQAQLLAKQWQKQIKMQNTTIYVCPLCKRKFKNEQEMNNHSKYSELHKYRIQKVMCSGLQL